MWGHPPLENWEYSSLPLSDPDDINRRRINLQDNESYYMFEDPMYVLFINLLLISHKFF